MFVNCTGFNKGGIVVTPGEKKEIDISNIPYFILARKHGWKYVSGSTSYLTYKVDEENKIVTITGQNKTGNTTFKFYADDEEYLKDYGYYFSRNNGLDVVFSVTNGVKVEEINFKNASYTLTDKTPVYVIDSILPTNATNKTLEYTSSNENVVKFEAGKITAVSNGTAIITAKSTDGTNVSRSCNVTVNLQKPDVILDKTQITFNDTAPVQLNVTEITPSISEDKSVIYESSDTSVATVNMFGFVTPVSNGTCNITATTTDGREGKGTCKVTVDFKVTEMEIDKTELVFTKDETQTIGIKKLLPEYANNKELQFRCSNTTVVTVDEEGVVTPMADGNAVIDVITKDGSRIKQRCNVEVKFDVAEVHIDKTELLFKSKTEQSLDIKVLPAKLDNTNYIIENSDESIATITQDGKVTPVSNGTCKITITSEKDPTKKAVCNVTVDYKVTKITLEKSSMTLTSNDVAKVAVSTITPDYANNKEVQFISSNEEVATVDSEGNVTPHTSGKTTIRVEAKDGNGAYASCIVTVDIKVTNINLSTQELTLTNMDKYKVEYGILPENANNKEVTWSSTNTRVATVSADGTITPTGNGKCYIKAKTKDGSNITASVLLTVDIKSTSIYSSDESVTLTDSNAYLLRAYTLPENANVRDVTFKSSDETIATIDSDGYITPILNGTCNITITSTDGTNLTKNVEVKVNFLVKQIQIDKTSLTFNNKEKQKITVTNVLPENAKNKEYEFSSSDEDVVTVDSQGNVTPVNDGTAKIIVNAKDGSNTKAECNVTVDIVATSVEIEEKNITLTTKQPRKINVVYEPDGARNKELIWTSSDENIAKVDEQGRVTAVNNGNCTISCKLKSNESLQSSCEVTVDFKVTKIQVNPYILQFNSINKQQLSIAVSPNYAKNKEIEWKSSDESVATVDSNGIVTAVSNGTAKIIVTAKDGSNVKAECDVTVDIKAISVSLDKGSLTLNNNNKDYTLSASIYPENTNNKNITWNSSDEKIAKVDEQGKVTAIANGKCTITATTENGKKAYCYVSVDLTNPLVPEITVSKLDNSLGEEYVEGTWTSSDVYVEFASTDTYGQIDHYELSQYNVNWSEDELYSSYGRYNAQVMFTNTRSGKVYFRAVDNAGNVSEPKEYVVNIDKTAPTINLSRNGGEYSLLPESNFVTVEEVINVTENESGVNNLKYQFSKLAYIPDENDLNWKTFENGVKFSENLDGGIYYVYTFVTDNAGNKTKLKSEPFSVYNTVKYDANGGIGTMDIDKVKYGDNYAVKENRFTKVGYTFKGWNDKKDGTGENYTSYIGCQIPWTNTSSIILYAIWEPNTYTVKYNANGGVGEIADDKITYLSNYTPKENSFTKAGYTFAGWNDKIDGTGNNYSSTFNYNFANDLTLYAIWEPNTYTVKYDANGGVGKTQDSIHVYDVEKKLSKNEFTREKYIFIGWNDKKDETKAKYNDEQVIKNIATNGEITLYAIWEKEAINPESITLDKEVLTLNNDEVTLKATILPEDANTNTGITWISSDENIAKVQDGKITPISSGTCKITARTGNFKEAICNVTVDMKVTKITLDKEEITFTNKEAQKINATVEPEGAKNKNLIFSNSDEKIATVDSTGNVTPIANGTAVITCTSTDGTNITKTCNVTVNLYKKGDFNQSGKVDVTDAYLLLTSIAQNKALDANIKAVMDMNSDNVIDVTDAYLLLKQISNS